ncbi:DNA repair protein REV1 isoform X2 [Centruroides vittatus]|uniref:DNA repair protein REV1 isoform X2 n=1 Tax=Centruroides vittatus TaxID=120091 RepID=UPI00350E995C
MSGKREQFGTTGFEDWGGYMNAKKRKLDDQFNEQKPFELCYDEGSKLFQNIEIYVNGYTSKARSLNIDYFISNVKTIIIFIIIEPSSAELKRLMMLHGGRYNHYYSQKTTTHIIAINLPVSKIRQLKGEKVVRPEWITDSIKAGKLLPESNYYLYNLSRNQKTLNFVNNNEINSDYKSTHSEIKDDDYTDLLEAGCLNSNLKELDNNQLEVSSIRSEENKILHKNQNAASPSDKSKSSLRAGDHNFLSEFYNHSRLHHISTAKSDFQAYVAELRNDSNRSFPGFNYLKNEFQNREEVYTINSKIFMHIDMDCFFVSVSLLNHPHLKGKPVAVTHSRSCFRPPPPGSNRQYEYNYYREKYKRDLKNLGDNHDLLDAVDEFGSTSEIASCNYEARKYGLKNGFFLGEAKKMCPELVTIPYDFEGYKRVSKLLYDIVASYTLDIQAVSCDEMFIDCNKVLEETKATPLEFASILRKEIEDKTGCMASVGIATKVAKPNGQYMVDDDKKDEFMKKQLIKDLPGVGYALQKSLESMNLKTCEDLQSIPLGKLQDTVGRKTGLMLHEYSRGIDSREIKMDNERKSVSAEINYGMRFKELHEATNFLKELSEEIQNRLLKNEAKGKSVTLKLKIRKDDAPKETSKFMGHGVCNNITKTLQLANATNNSVTISKACTVLLQNLKINPENIRGMGIQIGRLEKSSEKVTEKNQTLLSFINQGPSDNKSLPKCQNSNFDNSTKDEYLPEIDPDIFASLPEDLQKEITLHYKSKGKDINFGTNNSSNSSADKLNSAENHSENNNRSNEIQHVALPNFSQIDQTVFDVLPNEVKQEIMDAYSKRSIHPLMQKSPIKSPFKSPKKSPTSKNKTRKKTKTKMKSATNNLRTKTIDTVIKSATITKEECTRKPNLCGATSLDDVKQLLSEWVEFSPVPRDDDVTIFSQYMVDVAKEKNLEKLDRIIKYLHRLVKNTSNEDWQAMFKNIVSSVQSTMMQIYGSVLKIDIGF